jgi:hypothetical protein
MLSFQAAQTTLLVDIISTYNKSVVQAASIPDLQKCSKVMFQEVTSLIFTNEIFTLRPKGDPQDILREEHKH